jgi:S-adenosylmethionine:tRNA ribosyltransferase-isomerase
MKLSDLKYDFPEELIAQSPSETSRILLNKNNEILEISKSKLLDEFQPGDILVINDTKVDKRRVFGKGLKFEFEVLFVNPKSDLEWYVLFPSSKLKKNEVVALPGDNEFVLIESGIPQVIRLKKPLESTYFERYGELPLPPYIQKARQERHNNEKDSFWYQTDWAEKSGSQAAPTASLHFKKSDLENLRQKGVLVETITLHIGLGTFLPVKSEDLSEHIMHSEWCSISDDLVQKIKMQKQRGSRVWALGTTVTRTLESQASGLLKLLENDWVGDTNLFIKDGYQFKYVDCLLTNFHQPESTLLALVATFAGLENVKKTYSYAIEKRFRLFSYGDLTVWIPSSRA